MALVDCPECGNQVSDRAWMCPHCGLPISGRAFGYEYRSPLTLFGLPLVHIVMGMGINPMTGRPRIAKGIIAIGNVAVGVLAIGGVAFGVVSIGGLALGLATLGGCSVGLLLAVGGLAIGTVAVGACAIGYYALGGAALGVHRLGSNAQDSEAVEFFRRYLGDWVDQIRRSGNR